MACEPQISSFGLISSSAWGNLTPDECSKNTEKGMNRATEARRTAPSPRAHTMRAPEEERRQERAGKGQRNSGWRVSKFNEKCKSAHSEISINSPQDQGREGHSQVQFSKNAEKDRFSSEQQLKISLSQGNLKKINSCFSSETMEAKCSGKIHPKFSKPLLTTTKKTQTPYQTTILYTAKPAFKQESRAASFPDKQKLSDFTASRSAFQERSSSDWKQLTQAVILIYMKRQKAPAMLTV